MKARYYALRQCGMARYWYGMVRYYTTLRYGMLRHGIERYVRFVVWSRTGTTRVRYGKGRGTVLLTIPYGSQYSMVRYAVPYAVMTVGYVMV
jgi:hypothetical protein